MILAIDGYEANVPHRVGSGRYAFEIIRHLSRLVEAQSAHTVQMYLPQDPLTDMPEASSHWQYRVLGPRRLWTFFGLPLGLTLSRPQANVVFTPTHYAPRFIHIPRVISIMDLSYIHYPELFRAKDLHQLIYWTRYSVGHAARILTISEFSKNAIIDEYHVPESRVVVTYPGMTSISSHQSSLSNLCGRYGFSKHYILSVGTLQPRKNYTRLIAAFGQFLKNLKQKYGSIDLVIVGKKGWLYEEILAAPKEYGVAGNVKFLDFVPDSDLPTLYSNALCLAFPSLYEGFGLPVLEAMAYGCPVVVSNSSSIPEIAGTAGVYVDPLDVESIAKGLLTAVRQRNLQQGASRKKAGLVQVKKFTWENAAKLTLAVLEDVAKGVRT